jgi:orotidine-5'-phosphate decarboxylase
MKSKAELQSIIDKIAAADSPVGMDAVYVHALILDHLQSLSARLDQLEKTVEVLGKAK